MSSTENEGSDIEECSIGGGTPTNTTKPETKARSILWIGLAVLLLLIVLGLGLVLGLSLGGNDNSSTTISATQSESINSNVPVTTPPIPSASPVTARPTTSPLTINGDLPTPSGPTPFINVGCFRNETSPDQHDVQSSSADAKAWECSEKCLTFHFGMTGKVCHCFVKVPSERRAIGSCSSVNDGTPQDLLMEVYFNEDTISTCSQEQTETVRNFLVEEDDAPFGFDIVKNEFKLNPFDLYKDECGTNIYEVQTEVSEGSQSLQTSMETIQAFARERRSERSSSLQTSASAEVKSFLFSASAKVSASFDSEQTNLFKTTAASEAESRVFTSTGIKRLAEIKIVDFDNTYRFVTLSVPFGNLLRDYLSSGFEKDKAYEIIKTYGQFVLTRGIFGGYMELRTTMLGSDVSRLFQSESEAKACYEASISAKATGFGFKGSASVSSAGCSAEAARSLQESQEAFQSEVSEQTVVGGRKECGACEEFVVEAQDATLLTAKDKYPVGDEQGVQFRLLSDFLAADKISPLEIKRLQITENQFDAIHSKLQTHILEYLSEVSNVLGGCNCASEALPFLKEDESGSQVCSCYNPESEQLVSDGPGVACEPDPLENPDENEVVFDESIGCPAPTVSSNPATIIVAGALQTGKECVLSVRDLALAIGHRDWIRPDIDLESTESIKSGQGTVLRARNERTGREGGLLVWSDGVDGYGAWNPREYSGSPDWLVGDVITLLDLPKPPETELAGVSCYRKLTETGWDLEADNIRFGKTGLVGEWWKKMTIEYDLKEDRGEIITGVWSDSNLPYSVQYYDSNRNGWVIMYKNCVGSVVNLATARAKRWRLDWESTDLFSSAGLSTYRSGGGFHAELLV